MNPLLANQIVQSYGHWAILWLQQLWLASWQGGIVIFVVWLICRLLPQLPARAQCWLWRMVYCKLLLGLCWFIPIPPLVISLPPDVPIHHRAMRKDVANGQHISAPNPIVPTGQNRHAIAPDSIYASPHPKLDAAVAAVTVDSQHWNVGPIGGPPSALDMKLTQVYLPGVLPNDAETFLVVVVDIVWAAGVLCCLIALLVQTVRLSRLRMSARSLAGTPLAAVTDELARQIGLRRCPRLVASHDAEAPLIMGLLRPVIVIPELALNSYSAADMRLILTHELMHIRAGDLWWMSLAAVTETLFFYHPLVWLAGRNFSLVREAACDSAVLHTSGVAASDYARLLLKIVTAKPKRETFIATLSAAVGYRELKRRIVLLQFAYGDAFGPGLRLALFALIIYVGVCLVPWRITALAGSIVQPHRYLAYKSGSGPGQVTITRRPPNGGIHAPPHSVRGLLIGETVALPGQPQHLIARYSSQEDANGYWLDCWDLGPVPGRRPRVHLNGTWILSAEQRSLRIVGPMTDQSPRDTRLHAQLHRTDQRGVLSTDQRGVLSMPSDFLDSSCSMEGVMISNSSELTLGDSSVQVSFHQAFVIYNNILTFIGTLPGGTYSTAVGFNSAAYVTGSADAADGTEHAYLWHNGRMQDLGPGHAQAINEHNQIVGYYTTPAGYKHACLWRNEVRVDLGTLGGADSMANAINNFGNIVGESRDADGVPHAFLYADRKMLDLNDCATLGTTLVLVSANAIEDDEVIGVYGALPQVAQSGNTTFQRRGLVLEPASLARQ